MQYNFRLRRKSSCAIRNWDYNDVLNLSHNKIGDNPKPFFSWLINSIVWNTNIENLILSDNGFSEEYKNKTISSFKDCSAYWKKLHVGS